MDICSTQSLLRRWIRYKTVVKFQFDKFPLSANEWEVIRKYGVVDNALESYNKYFWEIKPSFYATELKSRETRYFLNKISDNTYMIEVYERCIENLLFISTFDKID